MEKIIFYIKIYRMVKKIKVVAIENVETPEPVETSASVEIPESLPPTPEPMSDEASQVQEETSSSQIKLLNPRDETPEEPKLNVVEPAKESKPKKQEEKITCANCNKTMLMKTYKYTHQKLCKPKEPEPVKVVEEKPKAKKQATRKETPSQPSNLGQVSFSEYKETHNVIPDPLEIYRAAKEHRQQVRIQRVKSLISQAI